MKQILLKAIPLFLLTTLFISLNGISQTVTPTCPMTTSIPEPRITMNWHNNSGSTAAIPSSTFRFPDGRPTGRPRQIFCVSAQAPVAAQFHYFVPQVLIKIEYPAICNQATYPNYEPVYIYEFSTDISTWQFSGFQQNVTTGPVNYNFTSGTPGFNHYFAMPLFVNYESGSVFIKTIQLPDRFGHSCDSRIDTVLINRPLDPRFMAYSATRRFNQILMAGNMHTFGTAVQGLSGSTEVWISGREGRSLGNPIIWWSVADNAGNVITDDPYQIAGATQWEWVNPNAAHMWFVNTVNAPLTAIHARAAGCPITGWVPPTLPLTAESNLLIVQLAGTTSATAAVQQFRTANPQDDDKSIRLAPNPAAKTTTLQLPADIKSAYITVLDGKGTVMLKMTARGESTPLNISALASGSYVVRITESNGQVTTKTLVVER